MRKRIKHNAKRAYSKWMSLDLHDRIIWGGAVIYMLVVSIYMLSHRAWFSPDQFFVFALFGVMIIGRTKQFLWDWVPVLLLLFGYEYLRGFASHLTQNVNITPMINADKLLFGFIPSIRLQELLYTPNVIHWYDWLAVLLYISHFVIPMLVAFIFWLDNRAHFKEYAAAILTLSYLAFATYVIFPAMPPWMASEQGYLPPLQKVMDRVLANFAAPIDVPSVYRFFGANMVAAIPSVHAAYPVIILIAVVRRFKYWGLFLIPYVLGVWFAILYLGEHYFIDAVIGALYAISAYLIIIRWNKFLKGMKLLFKIPKKALSFTLRFTFR